MRGDGYRLVTIQSRHRCLQTFGIGNGGLRPERVLFLNSCGALFASSSGC